MLEKIAFVGVLKVNDENSGIRIRNHKSEVRSRGSGSESKCYRSAALTKGMKKLSLPLQKFKTSQILCL
jgi:hypothetical protein